jgi:hypothetical protein
MSTQDRAGFSIKEWCLDAGISEALYYKRKRQGLISPHEVQVNRRTVIIEPAHDYLSRLKAEAASAPPIGEAR